jgi:hypothetical protein
MKLELVPSGRSVSLTRVYQYKTYLGFLGGLPHKDLNDNIINEAVALAKKDGFLGSNPYLIPPERRDFRRKPGDVSHWEGPVPPEWLPRVACITNFESDPARDSTKDFSSLTVVWFQDEFCFPIDKAILSQLREIKWEELADDFEF